MKKILFILLLLTALSYPLISAPTKTVTPTRTVNLSFTKTITPTLTITPRNTLTSSEYNYWYGEISGIKKLNNVKTLTVSERVITKEYIETVVYAKPSSQLTKVATITVKPVKTIIKNEVTVK